MSPSKQEILPRYRQNHLMLLEGAREVERPGNKPELLLEKISPRMLVYIAIGIGALATGILLGKLI